MALMMNRYKVLVLFSMCLILSPAYGETVCSVHDGDTFRVAQKACNTEETRSIRMWGFDAPEIKQTYGPEARDFMKKLTTGREVILDCVSKSYKRAVCKVTVSIPDGSGGNRQLDLGSEMVGWGYAYDYTQYSKGRYSQAEAFAHRNGRGVWALPGGGVRPWDFRKSLRKGNSAAPVEQSGPPAQE